MTTAARRHPIFRFLLGGVGFAVYAVGGGSVLTYLLTGAATAQQSTAPVQTPAREVVITLSAFDTPHRVVCVTSADLVASDTLLVSDFDLPAIYTELGCTPPDS
jgi:hypothetical protein